MAMRIRFGALTLRLAHRVVPSSLRSRLAMRRRAGWRIDGGRGQARRQRHLVPVAKVNKIWNIAG